MGEAPILGRPRVNPIETDSRRRDVRSATKLAYLTVIWMAVEFASSVALGVISGSLLLLAFGVDSLIELVSGALVLRLLLLEIRWGASEQTARRTARWTGYLLFALAAYVVASSAYGLIAGHKADADLSAWGLIIAVIALIGMPILGRSKRWLAAPARLNSPSLRADAAESLSCAYLAGVLLIGLLLTKLLGWWWLDSVAALALVPFIISEGREALEKEDDEDG